MPEVASVTSAEMSIIDKRMSEEFHIDLLMMMENAGKALALQARSLLANNAGKRILVMAGKGNNGGGGLVAARHLHNWGARIEVVLSSGEQDMKETPLRQARILRAIGVRVLSRSDEVHFPRYDLVIDALLGYNQRGSPRGEVARLVNGANTSGIPILALDIPTGLDPDTGNPHEPCIRATQTLTLALPKKGLCMKKSKRYVGKLFLADISVPRRVYRELGLRRALFSTASVIELASSA